MASTTYMRNLSDEELVKLFIETNKDVYFEYLYDRYADKVYRKCLSFVKDPAKAEDFTHDIFLKLVLSLNSYKEHAKFSTWLYSITYNFCVDKVRTAKKVQEVELDDNFDSIDDSDDSDLKEIEAQRLRDTLREVSPDERAILLMKYQEDLSIKDIADVLGVTESAVKMRLKRAKEKVRKLYLENFIFWAILIGKMVAFMQDFLDK
ncbi:MAG: RNA polymerase sigma factor [Spirosomataceae bacterium]